MPGMPGSMVNYFMRSVIAVAIEAVQHDPSVASEQLALHRQVSHP
jgi:hypothetical protein